MTTACHAVGCPLRDDHCAGVCGDLTPGGFTEVCTHPLNPRKDEAMTITERSRCGHHGTDTSSGRCATCDQIAGFTAPHPAKWSKPVLTELADVIDAECHREGGRPLRILDPFAGRGRYELAVALGGHFVCGVELEPEWAMQDPEGFTFVGSALDRSTWPTWEPFDAVVTSPVYPNRMTDHHEARDDSTRHTYRHYLGRMPSAGAASILGWGTNYRKFHEQWLREAIGALRCGGLLVVNMKNHLVPGTDEEERVVEWWVNAILLTACWLVEVRPVATRGQRHGQNGDKRAPGEMVIVARTPMDRRLL